MMNIHYDKDLKYMCKDAQMLIISYIIVIITALLWAIMVVGFITTYAITAYHH
jgi:hypothetical protein